MYDLNNKNKEKNREKNREENKEKIKEEYDEINNKIIIKRYENDKIAFNYPSHWYEFENEAKNPTEVVAMKTDKGKGGKFSFSVANSGGKSTEYWKNFMENFFKDNGAIISESKMRKKEEISIFDFKSEISKSNVSSFQRHIGFVNDGAFFYSFFTSLDLDALKDDIDIMIGL